MYDVYNTNNGVWLKYLMAPNRGVNNKRNLWIILSNKKVGNTDFININENIDYHKCETVSWNFSEQAF